MRVKQKGRKRDILCKNWSQNTLLLREKERDKQLGEEEWRCKVEPEVVQ